MIKCPNCEVEMHQVQTFSHYGAHIFLDQCPDCGGIWFDDLELYEVGLEHAKGIEDIDAEKLRKIKKQKVVLMCPKDQQPLQQFNDPYFPETIIVESCLGCGGFWLNRGEFSQFQTIRAEKKKQTKLTSIQDQEFEAQLQKILESGSKNYDTLGNIGKFLSTPISPMTLEPIGSRRGDGNKQNSIALIVIDVVATILKLLIYR